jgi:hypothetical protein
MLIATYNVNGINGRLSGLLAWLKEAAPDVACLQELKAPDEKFPEAAIRAAGYGAIWSGQKSWNGVAILARGKPLETRRGLPGDPDDTHSRYIEAAIDGKDAPRHSAIAELFERQVSVTRLAGAAQGARVRLKQKPAAAAPLSGSRSCQNKLGKTPAYSWLRSQSRANPSPGGNSLLTGKITGNIAKSGPIAASVAGKALITATA